MTKKIKYTVAMGIAYIALNFSLEAADGNPPELMTYQGYLVDGTGAPLGAESPENHDVVFRIYTALESGVNKWSEQQTVTVDKGYFSVLLGEGSQFNSEPYPKLSSVFYGDDISDRFMGMTVILNGSGNELTPRLRWVSSPFAFSSSQARQLIDDSGNRNFYKDGAELRLGVGAESTLNIKENGDVDINGKLNVKLPAYGYGLTLRNGAKETQIGAGNSGHFHFYTDMTNFWFERDIQVQGKFLSFNRDAILQPMGNSGDDNYLKIYKGSDLIEARTDELKVTGDSGKTFQIKMKNTTEFHTSNPQFFMNKKLNNAGGFYVDNDRGIKAVTGNYGSVQTVGGGKANWEGYSIDGRYVFMSADNNNVGIYNDVDNKWVTFYEKNHDNGGRYRVFLNSQWEALRITKSKTEIKNSTKIHGTLETTSNLLVNGQINIKNKTYFNEADDGKQFQIRADDYDDRSMMTFDKDGKWIAMFHAKDGKRALNLTHGNGQKYASYDGDNNWDFYSDKRLKKNIEKEEKILQRIMKINVVNYDYIDEEKRKHKEIGMIAQEVEPLFPSLVSESDNDPNYGFKVKSLGYSSFGILAVGAVKELKKEKDDQVAALQEQNQSLRADVNKLREELSEVKDLLSDMGTLSSRLKDIEGYVSRLEKTN
jgi:hypothetical protein